MLTLNLQCDKFGIFPQSISSDSKKPLCYFEWETTYVTTGTRGKGRGGVTLVDLYSTILSWGHDTNTDEGLLLTRQWDQRY